ncbi:MAG: DUF349 domain-containing protein [Pseudomonadales bacterium]
MVLTFHKLELQLKELEDWQHYATNTKRRELCKQMVQLAVANETHPDEKAKLIKELQQSWQQLGASDSREGQILWRQFKPAGDAAFIDCAKYFAMKRRTRHQNLQERTKICVSLAGFVEKNDWQNADWKAVNEIIKAAKSEWKRFADIPHREKKTIQNRFHQSLKLLESKLKNEQHRNHGLKEEYIQEVQALIDSEKDMLSKVREVKAIQSRWQKVRITDRGFDQRLWKEFRKYCDIVFERRDQETDQASQVKTEQLLKAATLCDQFSEKLGNKISQQDLRDFRQSFAEFEFAGNNEFQSRYKSLEQSALNYIKNAEQRKNEQALLEPVRKVELCEQLEDGADQEMIVKQWEKGTDLTKQLPEDIQKILCKRYAEALSGDVQYADTQFAEELCVRIEMLAHVSSPESAQLIRMKLHVEHLDQKLGKGLTDDRSMSIQFDDLIQRWYLMGAVKGNEHKFKKRIAKAIAAIAKA